MSAEFSDRLFPLPKRVDPFVQTLVDKVLDGKIEPLNEAVQRALDQGVQGLEKWGIVDGHTFLLHASGMMRWIPSENVQCRAIYDFLCTLYFVLDQQPVVDLQNPIRPDQVGEPLLPISRWVLEFSQRIGDFMDTEESLTYEPNGGSFATFAAIPDYNLGQADFSSGKPKTFNQLFGRKLKPGMRPIYRPGDDTAITWPADATFDKWSWSITNSSEVTVKGLTWNIADLLKDSKYAGVFGGGKWMHALLNTFDYHRQHAPVSGKVVEARIIQGLAHLQVQAKKDPKTGKKILVPDREWNEADNRDINGDRLDAPDKPGYEFLQTRGCFVIRNPVVGYVAILPIGMAHVSSVVPSVQSHEGGPLPNTVKKGDEISYFQFGGSDIVTVFQKHANIDLSQLVNRQHYTVGQLLGVASPAS